MFGRSMGRLGSDGGNSWRDRRLCTEYLGVNERIGCAPGLQCCCEFLEKTGRPTEIEVRCLRYVAFFQQEETQATFRVVITSLLISIFWMAVNHYRVTPPEPSKEIPHF